MCRCLQYVANSPVSDSANRMDLLVVGKLQRNSANETKYPLPGLKDIDLTLEKCTIFNQHPRGCDIANHLCVPRQQNLHLSIDVTRNGTS